MTGIPGTQFFSGEVNFGFSDGFAETRFRYFDNLTLNDQLSESLIEKQLTIFYQSENFKVDFYC